MGKRVIITGATGMVGKGVLLECLDSQEIEKVLLVSRSSIGTKHAKLEEVLLPDLAAVATVQERLQGYDACFYCMGISALGLSEAEYDRITYQTAKAFADVLYALNPNMVFNYVSGQGTDGSEKGSIMWARVKGKTENMVFAKGFKTALAFRPGVILPERGIKSRTPLYNFGYLITRPFFPLMRLSNNVTSTTRIGQAMVNTLFQTPSSRILDNAAINEFASKKRS